MVQPLININRNQALVFAAFLVLYEFLAYVANDMIMPGMIDVVHSFNAPGSYVANSLTAYILGGASLQIILGPLSDRFGRRPVMLGGVCLFLICTLFITQSQSIEQFIIARFFQGMGLCFIGVIGYATLQEIFAERDAVKLIAIMANVSILAPLIGPLIGSIIIHLYSWRFIFFSISILTLLALVGLWRFMPETIGQTTYDGHTFHKTPLSPTTILRNYSSLLKNRTFLFGSIAEGLFSVPCLGWIALSPIILIEQAHLSVVQYGLWQIPIFSASILGNWTLTLLTNRWPLNTILLAGVCLGLAGLALILLLPFFISADFIWLMPGLLIYFFSLGIASAPLGRLILFATPVPKGTTSALMTLIVMVLLALGIEAANWVYAERNNLMFGMFSMGTGLLFALAIWLGKLTSPKASTTL